MRGWRVAVLGLLVIALAGAPAAMAARAAPPPSGAAQTLWAHHDATGYFMSTLMDEPDQDSGAPGYNAIIFALGPVDGGAPLEANWVLPLAPALDAAVALDATKPVHFTLYLAAFAAGPFTGTLPGGQGQATGTVTVELRSNGAVLAAGAEQDASIKEGTPSKFEWDVLPAAASLSGAVEWHITFSGAGTGLGMGQGDAVGRSFVTVPAVGGGPALSATKLYRTFTGASVDNTTTFAAPTTQQMQFNWTTSLRNVTVALDAVRQNGTISVAILDAANRTVLAHSFAANATGNDSFSGFAPGAWRIFLNATAFQGSLRIRIGEFDTRAVDDGVVQGTGGTTGSAGGSGAGSSASDTSSTGKGTPGFELLAAVMALALLAVRRRS